MANLLRMQHAGRNNCIEIHSKDNKTVKLAASLAEKKHRDALGAYLIEGPNLVREALQQGVRIQFIFTGAGALNQQQEIQDIPAHHGGGGKADVADARRFFPRGQRAGA